MAELDKLGLTEDPAPNVDWDAPEGGKTPPAVFPGRFVFRFALPEDKNEWFNVEERDTIKGNPASKRKILELTYVPFVIANSAGQPIANEDGSPIQLGPQRVSNFQSPKMRIHSFAEIIRAMGARYEKLIENGTVSKEVLDLLDALNGQATFEAEVIWRAYFKSTQTTVSTHPRKKAGELAWPRGADGTPELMATNPGTGEKAYAYPEVTGFHTPSAESGNQQNLASGA